MSPQERSLLVLLVSMVVSRMSYVRCDSCGDPGEMADNARDAREVALSQGWKRRNGRDLCPSCLAKEGQ